MIDGCKWENFTKIPDYKKLWLESKPESTNWLCEYSQKFSLSNLTLKHKAILLHL